MSSPLLTDVRPKSFLLLVTSLGVVLIVLGGVNLVFLQVTPKFITIFTMLPDPISYSESELLSLLRHFRFLVFSFLITFLKLVQFLAQLRKGLLYEIGFLSTFLSGT